MIRRRDRCTTLLECPLRVFSLPLTAVHREVPGGEGCRTVSLHLKNVTILGLTPAMGWFVNRNFVFIFLFLSFQFSLFYG